MATAKSRNCYRGKMMCLEAVNVGKARNALGSPKRLAIGHSH